MNRKTFLSVPLIWALALSSSVLSAVGDTFEERNNRFKLFSNCNRMTLVVEDLPAEAKKIGLTREAIQAAVESRLRSARLYDSERFVPYLYINVLVVGKSFSVSVEYKKEVYDPLSGESMPTTAWERSTTGTHGGDSGYILSTVSRNMDRFLLEFLRVNEEACEKR
jgi:hypothetical protein